MTAEKMRRMRSNSVAAMIAAAMFNAGVAVDEAAHRQREDAERRRKREDLAAKQATAKVAANVPHNRAYYRRLKRASR